MDRWRGKVALVTGASVGIGAAVAKHLVTAMGVNVVGCARNLPLLTDVSTAISAASSSNATTKTTNGAFIPVQCDIRDERAILSVFELIRARFGRLDICVNNSGMATADGGLIDGQTEDWRAMLDVNVLGLSIVARESVRLMVSSDESSSSSTTTTTTSEGHIFHIGSMSGHRIPSTDNSTFHFYAATKHAVRALTEGLRRECRAAQLPIRVTLISPGMMEPAQPSFINRFQDSSSFDHQQWFGGQQEPQQRLPRALQPGDIARVVEQALAMPPHVDLNDILVRPLQQAD